MAFNGTEGKMISLTEASLLTKQYRANNPGDVQGNFYGIENLKTLLDNKGCVGIRIYYGLDETGSKQMVLVGVDQNENDILNLVLENGKLCPPFCGIHNTLNSTLE